MIANNFLNNILEHKREDNKNKELYFSTIKKQLSKTSYPKYNLFKKQISQKGKINLIAEIKKASPSRGVIRETFDVLDIARIYSNAGADVISILTEEKYFLGKPDYVKKVSEKYNLPILAKDFFIDEGQIYEARLNGASAILLVMVLLKDNEIKHLMNVADSLDMNCLVEVHNENELIRALDFGAEIIGVNNRNLTTFEVSLDVCSKLIPMIPKDKVIVAESGIKTQKDIRILKELGVNAVLIGEVFMKSDNMENKIKEIMEI